MSLSLFLGRIPCLRPSAPLLVNPTTTTTTTTPIPFASSKTTTHQASAPNSHFAVADLLVQSCGLSPDQALEAASKYTRSLRYPDRPHAVLQFLRQIGIRESGIRAAVLRDPRILRFSVEKNWRPNIAKLQEVGFSLEDISGIISCSPGIFRFNFVPKSDFWLGVLGSAENLSVVLRRRGSLLNCNLEKVVLPKLSFLKEQCGLSARQLVRLIKLDATIIQSRSETLRMKVKRAEELGIVRSSRMFVYALIIVGRLSKHTLDARLNNLKSLGLSQEEVILMISKTPFLVSLTEEQVARKLEFLITTAGCGMSDVIRIPVLLTYSLENRLIPRTVVRRLLMSKGLPVGNRAITSFMMLSEKQFVDEFVLPYEHVVPGLHQAYAGASPGSIGDIV